MRSDLWHHYGVLKFSEHCSAQVESARYVCDVRGCFLEVFTLNIRCPSRAFGFPPRGKIKVLRQGKIELTERGVGARLQSVNEALQRRVPPLPPIILEFKTWLKEACRV
ncbi:hypothetical protein PHAMO_10251 [Magnetospirillum molischianum DSM 120]|uniref:Uncharacterized protein n=1 Tax=Magnetospirillum molischianum DSM 120 TaxID=1150626 RepID=H8FN88_MAGML|nr:hypothetical protein PHAMO_10251 [Magnetospirillum molischianum DSM 120]